MASGPYLDDIAKLVDEGKVCVQPVVLLEGSLSSW